MKAFRYGLKLWSTNRNYLRAARELWEKKQIRYIELFVQPGSYAACADMWRGMSVPFVVHAPHYMQGLNFSQRTSQAHNEVLVEETMRWARCVNARYIIFHPGVGGDIRETARQMKRLHGPRVLVENKPYHTVLKNGSVCVGYSVEDIAYVMERTGHGCCLDLGHAICSAAAQSVDPFKMLRGFLALRPSMYHLSDGEPSSTVDKHAHIGHGSFDMPRLLALLPAGAMITVETEKTYPRSLRDFAEDVCRLRRIEKQVFS